MINPLHAVIDLARTLPTVGGLMDASNIKYDLEEVEVPPLTSYLVVSSVVPFSENYFVRWQGDVRFTAFARWPYTSQQLIEAVIEDMWDVKERWGSHRVGGAGKNAGAVITVDNVYNFNRGKWPLSGDMYTPYWAVDMSLLVSAEAMTWAT